MLNIFDPLFNLEDKDFLSVEDDLSEDNIENTIRKAVNNIAAINGYTEVQDIGFSNHILMDHIYDNDKSFIVPIFFENPVDGALGNTLTNANVSYMVITSLSGTINKPTINGETQSTYSTIDSNGKNHVDSSSDVLEKMLINLKFYRYMNKKLDYNPITSNFISNFNYCYINIEDGKKELILFTELFELSLVQQLITRLNSNFIPDNRVCTVGSDDITAIGGNDPGFIKPSGNSSNNTPNTCHCYNKIYMAYNQEN